MINGIGAYSSNITVTETPDSQNDQYIIYNYTNIKIPSNIILTLGFSYESNESPSDKVEEFNPKLGIQWALTDTLSLRAAAFKVVKRALTFEQTIEPTQIAQFNQMLDYTDTAIIENYGAALDIRFTNRLFGGLEVIRRNIDVPLGVLSQPEFYEILRNREDLYSAYLYWLPNDQWSLSTSLRYERLATDQDCNFCLFLYPAELKTLNLPLTLQYFHPSGFFGGLNLTYVHQDIRSLDRELFSIAPTQSENFILTNTVFGYRFPQRGGLLALQINNLFDKEFNYQDYNFQTTNNLFNPRYIPERTIYARLIFNF
jgi:outer membrane receptor for ferrienterochelin and colicin